MKTENLSSALLFFTLLLLLPSPTITAAQRLDRQLFLAISSLRSEGCKLFPHAMAKSYLLPSMIHNTNLTFFSPPDSVFPSLFSEPSLLRCISPFRILASRLRILSYGTCLKTLLPHHHLYIQRPNVPLNDVIWDPAVTVDGSRVRIPDLYKGSSIVVHGLADRVLLPDSKVLRIKKIPIDVNQYISWGETRLIRDLLDIMEIGEPWIND